MFFAQALGERGACFVHAAALVKGTAGILLPGESGAGKSSVARDCKGCDVFSDDSPVFRRQGRRYRIYPTPYHQMRTADGPIAALLDRPAADAAGVYFLVKDDATFLSPLSKVEALSSMLNHHILFFKYVSQEARLRLFHFICDALHALPVYALHFQKGQDVGSIIAIG
jgi:hypothetical protein